MFDEAAPLRELSRYGCIADSPGASADLLIFRSDGTWGPTVTLNVGTSAMMLSEGIEGYDAEHWAGAIVRSVQGVCYAMPVRNAGDVVADSRFLLHIGREIGRLPASGKQDRDAPSGWKAKSSIVTVSSTARWLFEDNTGAGGVDDSSRFDPTRTHVVITVHSGVPVNIQVNDPAQTSAWCMQAFPGSEPAVVPCRPGDRISVIASDGSTVTSFQALQVRA